MSKKKLFERTKFYFQAMICLLLVFIFSGCQLFIGDQELEMKKSVVSKAFEENKDAMRAYIVAENNSQVSRGETPELSEEEINYYLNNPDIVVEEMLNEEQGEEYLDFVYTTLVTSDFKIILEKAKPLITEEQYLEIKTNISSIETEIYDNQNISRSNSDENIDKYFHVMAGAAAASLTACLVYLGASWWTPSVKVVAALALGTAAALLAGAAKEIYDLTDDTCNAEFEDFMATTIGGFISSTICSILGALSVALTQSTVLSGIVSGVIAVYTFDESEFGPWLMRYIFKGE